MNELITSTVDWLEEQDQFQIKTERGNGTVVAISPEPRHIVVLEHRADASTNGAWFEGDPESATIDTEQKYRTFPTDDPRASLTVNWLKPEDQLFVRTNEGLGTLVGTAEPRYMVVLDSNATASKNGAWVTGDPEELKTGARDGFRTYPVTNRESNTPDIL